MKNLNLYAILLVILFWDVPAAAQKNLISRGDRQAELKNYAGAIYLYENAYEKNPESRELIEKLATSYRLTNQYAKALDFYGLLMARGNTGKEDAIHYADLLLRNGNIGSAREELEKLLKQYPGDEGIVLLMKNCDFADAQMASLSVKKRRIVHQERINSSSNEFGISFFGGNLIFSSDRSREEMDLADIENRQFTDLYTARFDTITGMFDDPLLLKGEINTLYNDGTFTTSQANPGVAYVTQCRKKPETCAIYRALLEKEKWVNLKEVSIGKTEYNYGHPALTADGKTVYFSSDMPGGKGGKDIWRAKVDAGGRFYDIRNLGESVNTAGDEMFPYAIGDSILLFASNGRVGMGGLDIYKVFIRDGIYEEAINVGAPVNSNADDFSVIVNKDLRGGYFCSNRENLTGGDDIFSFYHSIILPDIKGFVKELSTKEPLSDVSVTLKTPGEEPRREITDPSGFFELVASAHQTCGKAHELEFRLENYRLKTIEIPCFSEDTLIIYLQKEIKPLATHTIRGNVYDLKTRLPIEGASVNAWGVKGYYKDTLTDQQGRFVFEKVPSNDLITLTVSKKHYYTDSRLLETPSGEVPVTMSTETGYDTDFNLRAVSDTITVPDIFYDFDKSNIRADAVPTLNAVVKLFSLNPLFILEMGSHTDERGTDAYNKGLSERRGRSVQDYLINRGVNPRQIVSRAYGEQVPVVKDARTEADHQRNRRTTFMLIGYLEGEPYIPGGSALRALSTHAVAATRTSVTDLSDALGVQVQHPGDATKKFDFEEKGVFHIDEKGEIIPHPAEEPPAIPVRDPKSEENNFGVQIAAGMQLVEPAVQFTGISDIIARYGIHHRFIKGLYKYHIGSFATRAEAENVMKLLKTRGYRDCFVVDLKQ